MRRRGLLRTSRSASRAIRRARESRCRTARARTCAEALGLDAESVPAVEHGVGGARVETAGGEKCDPDVAGPQGVAAVPAALDLPERVDGEASRPLEPELVAGPLERLQECVPVASGPVADARAFLHPQRACLPDQFGAGDDELLVEVGSGGREDPGRTAPLELERVAARAHAPGPVREPVLAHDEPCENLRRLTLELLASRMGPECEDVADEAVHGGEAPERL